MILALSTASQGDASCYGKRIIKFLNTDHSAALVVSSNDDAASLGLRIYFSAAALMGCAAMYI